MSRFFPNFSSLSAAPQAISSNLTDMTLAMWLKVIEFNTQGNIALLLSKSFTATYIDSFPGFENGWGGETEGGDFTAFGESDTMPNALSVGEWTHIAYTLSLTEGGTPKLYINGIEIAEYNPGSSFSMTPGTQPGEDSGVPWLMGRQFGGGAKFELADVRVYNAVMDASQIAAISQGVVNPPPGNLFLKPKRKLGPSTNLVAWWKLCDDDPFADSTGNGNTLTDGGTTPGSSEPPVSVCSRDSSLDYLNDALVRIKRVSLYGNVQIIK